jgi:glycosyltransferase involved in cell wall biosynthesis
VKHFIIITPNLGEVSTGGLIWQQRFSEYAHRVYKDTETIDAMLLPAIARKSRLFNILYYTLRLLRGKNTFLFVDHNLHVRLSIPLWLNKVIRKNQYAVICHHTVHGLRESKLRRGVEFFSEKLILGNAVKIVVPSAKTSVDIQKFNIERRRTVVINPTLVFKADRVPARKNRKRILFVGNIEPRKGLDVLIKALSIIKEIDFSCEIVGGCYGYDSYFRSLQELVEDSGLSGRVVFRGKLDSSSTISSYENANIFVFPSLHEGYGMVLLEAMSFGLPIVASDVAPINEVLRDKLNAYLVPPRNEQSLARALREMLLAWGIQMQMGRRNFMHSKNFPSWDEVAAKTYAVVKPYLYDENCN